MVCLHDLNFFTTQSFNCNCLVPIHVLFQYFTVIKFGLPKSQAMIITDKKIVIMRAKNCKSSFFEKTVIQVLVNKKRSHPYSPKTQISVSVKHLNDVQILAQSINIILPIPKVTCRHQNISKLSP